MYSSIIKDKQLGFPYTKGCTPILIKNKWFGLLIIIGCVISPLYGYLANNSKAGLYLIPMSVSFILLPFTGLIRKIIYAIPLSDIMPAPLYQIQVKSIDKTDPNWKSRGIFFLFPWMIEIFTDWLIFGVGVLVLIAAILYI